MRVAGLLLVIFLLSVVVNTTTAQDRRSKNYRYRENQRRRTEESFTEAASLSSSGNAPGMPFTRHVGNIVIEQTHYFFTQQLDHFNPSDTRQWSQRVTVFNSMFHPSNGAVFILIGGEGEEDGLSNGSGWLVQLCQKFSGMVISVEHRFYGVSQPFGFSATSYSTENLFYLTVDQSLADLANVIVQVKANGYFGAAATNPFITIGGSYPGAMSAWFRYKYPHLTVGALASSAVVNAILDFQQYDYQIYTSTALSGEWCPQNIQHFNEVIEDTLKVGGAGADTLKNLFNAQTLSDLDFLSYFGDFWAGLVQYGGRTHLCSLFEPENFADQLANVVAYAKMAMPVDGYDTNTLKDTHYSEGAAGRQWTWQVCTEFGWLQTANNLEPMRSQQIDAAYYENQCKTVFGSQFAIPTTQTTNIMFGGKNLQATNIVFTNGIEDEWQWASIRSSVNGMQSIITNCTDCGHCAEFHTPSGRDSLALNQTRSQVEALFTQWIGGHFSFEKQSHHASQFYEELMRSSQVTFTESMLGKLQAE